MEIINSREKKLLNNNRFKEFFNGLFSRYVTHTDQTPEKEQKFHKYATRLLISTTEGMSWAFLFVIFMTWPPQFIYLSDWNQILQLSYWRMGASLFLILYLLGSYCFNWFHEKIRIFFIVGCSLILLIIGFFVGRLEELTYLYTHSYFVPFILVLYPAKILKRTLLTILFITAFVAGYLYSHPTYFGNPAIYERSVILLSMACLCVILGHIHFHLLRQNFFNQEELKDKNQELEFLNTHDSVTKLYNLSAFEKRLDEEFARAKRHDIDLSILTLEITNYEILKTRHGLSKIQKLMENIGNLFREHTRSSDIGARYAENRLCMILPETDLDGAKVLLDRLEIDLQQLINEGNITQKMVPKFNFSLTERKPSTSRPIELMEENLRNF